MDSENEISMLKLRLGNRDAEIDRLKAELRWAHAAPLIKEAALAQGATLKAIPDILERARSAGTWEARKDKDGEDKAVLVSEGYVAVGADGGDLTARSFVRSLEATAPHLVGKAVNGSDDAGPNPWAKPTWNLTQQGQILRDNPILARKLAQEAGAKIPALAD